MELLEYEKQHLDYLRGKLAECTVLLRKNGDFPLKTPEKIAAYGSGVRHTIKGGTGSGEVNSRFFVSVEQALEDAGFTVTTKKWMDAYDKVVEDAHVAFVKEIKAKAKAAHANALFFGMGAVMPEPEYNLPIDGEGDVAIYVLSRISGEGNDRQPIPGDIMLSETEKRDILAIHKKYKKFLLVLNVGGPVDLSPLSEIENILLLSQLGVDTGSALCDIMLGKAYPSGKLATTWSAWEDYPSIGDFGNHDDTRYKEGIYVGYRYFDSVGKKALFPFGFGLGYTEFGYKPSNVSVEGSVVTVSCDVKNIGNSKGKEVVQVYVSVPEGKLDQPAKALAAFAKTRELAPQEEDILTISFDMKDMASYDTESASYILEKGDYVIYVGTSSVDVTAAAIVQLDETAVVTKTRNCLGTPGFTDWKPEERKGAPMEKVQILLMSASSIKTTVVEYDKEQDIDADIKALSDEELAYLNVGAFNPKGGIASIIGNASQSVAGAAGETTRKVTEKGIPALVMADGPAGIRVAKDYFVDEKGVHSVGLPFPESLSVYMGALERFFMKIIGVANKPKGEVLHHYATAIPIGTAIAQSFNIDFARSCGDIVGDEMERIGVHLWLAPALNIHRSIRCGRNFEYYSEDPLVSGKFAAAITIGVQAHPGCGTTIKHYAANNQETNRYNNNSMVSERAMREIYLKGFEICVKDSQPKALMTSYNLLNGVHTSERRDLNEDILRSEFGYKGIVMTDWVIEGGTLSEGAAYASPVAYKVAASGNDVFMPGSKKEFDNLMESLANGSIERKQLEINATRVARMARELTSAR